MSFSMSVPSKRSYIPTVRVPLDATTRFLDTNPKLNARISGQPFEVAGVSIGRDIGLVGLGVEFIDAGGLSTFLGYDARFNTEFVEHNATIGILVRF